MAKSSYYTPRCLAFKAAFKGMPGVTTFEHELVGRIRWTMHGLWRFCLR